MTRFLWIKRRALTKWTKSLAAIARMSAQDTTPGHLLSTNALAFLMLSNPSGLSPLLSAASFSAATLLPGFVDIRIDPSQPCHFQELLNIFQTQPGNWNWLQNACSIKVYDSICGVMGFQFFLLLQSNHERTGEVLLELRLVRLWTVGWWLRRRVARGEGMFWCSSRQRGGGGGGRGPF